MQPTPGSGRTIRILVRHAVPAGVALLIANPAWAASGAVPGLALGLPFLFVVALIGWMYHVIAHRPGGQPIGALEAGFAKIGKLIGKLAPRRRRRVVPAA